MALTKRLVDGFTYEGKGRGADYRYDTKYGSGGVKGFTVRVHPDGRRIGRKTFEVWYRMSPSTSPEWFIIGECGTWTLQQARQKARELLVDIQNGIDPKAPTAAKELTVKECAKVFLEDAQTRDVTTWRGMERRFEKHIIPALGRKILLDVSRADIARLHTSISQEPRKPKVEANRIVQLLKTMFNRAERLGLVPEGHRNPCEGVELHRELSRARYLSDIELKKLDAALRSEPIHVQCLIRLYLLLGVRKQELLSLAWDDVHLDSSEGPHIYIGNTKNGRPLTLSLAQTAADLFRAIPTQVMSRWVFPSPRRTGHHLRDFKNYWIRIRDRAGIKDCTVHDLRRTCGSVMAQSGVPLQHISEVLNQSSPEVTKVYARLSQNNQLEASEKAAEVIDKLFGELSA